MDNVVSFGSGPRPLVVIPGLSVTKVTEVPEQLAPIFKPFTKGWTVHVIERPDEIPEGTTNASLAVEYVSAMNSLGLKGADIIGISQGGMIAQYILADHPEMVHKAVLAATLSRPVSAADAVFMNWLKLAGAEDWYGFNMDMFGRMYTDEYLAKYEDAFRELARTLRPEDGGRFIRLVKACMTGGPSDRLGAVRCPVLVVGTEDDPIVTGTASHEMAAALGCALHMYTGYRHGFFNEDPSGFYGLVLRWLEQ